MQMQSLINEDESILKFDSVLIREITKNLEIVLTGKEVLLLEVMRNF